MVGAFLSYVGFLDLESIHNGTETLQRYESKDSRKVLLNKYITHSVADNVLFQNCDFYINQR